MLPVRAIGLDVVNLGEHAPQAADVDRLPFQFALAHQQRQQGEYFLRAPQRKRRDHQAALLFLRRRNRGDQPLNFGHPRNSRGRGAPAARRFHDQHIRFHVLKPRALEDRLVVETYVAGIKQGLLLAAQ